MIQRDLPESNGEFVHQVLATLHWKKTDLFMESSIGQFGYGIILMASHNY